MTIDIKTLDEVDRPLVAAGLGLSLEHSDAADLFGPYEEYRRRAARSAESLRRMYLPEHAKAEVEFSSATSIAKGAKGPLVRKIQEHLVLAGLKVKIDGDFGPATERALYSFAAGHAMVFTDPPKVDSVLWDSHLAKPLIRAVERVPREDTKSPYAAWALAIAKAHLKEHPREVGGQNMGPWVRLYMRGNEGPAWPWCAGFVSYVMDQAAIPRGEPLPVRSSFYCDLLAQNGKLVGRFASAEDIRRKVTSEDHAFIFLVRRTSWDWIHTGFGYAMNKDGTFQTIEGNTNDEGSREGHEVCSRIRSSNNMDFIFL